MRTSLCSEVEAVNAAAVAGKVFVGLGTASLSGE